MIKTVCSKIKMYRWGLGLLFALGLVIIIPTAGAIAAQCQRIEGQEMCLVSIKRSAKYHWEYRAVLAIDGKKKPPEKFDCRHLEEQKQGDRRSVSTQKKAFICDLIPKR